MRSAHHKYGAVRTEVDGISFASKVEARRYAELRLLEKAGAITELERQPAFELSVDNGDYPDNGEGRAIVLGIYRADFRYKRRLPGMDVAAVIVEDVKGYDVPLQKWKRKHAEAQHGITVDLITDRRRHADGKKTKTAKKKARR